MSRLPALSSLEGSICELAEMAELAANYVGETITDMTAHKEKVGALTPLGPQDCRLFQFCVYHLEKMAHGLKEEFYEGLKAAGGEVP